MTPWTDPLRMIEAFSLRCGAADWTVKKTPVTLVRRMSSNAARSVLPTGVTPEIPALAKTMSSLPKARTASATALSIEATSLASARMASRLSPSSAAVASSTTALRQCRDWLRRLQRGERVIVNLRPESGPETEYVAFDGPRILRALGRIIADLAALAGLPPQTEEEPKDEDAEARRVRHRKSL